MFPRVWLAVLLFASLAAPANAVMADPRQAGDARRFGLDQPNPARKSLQTSNVQRALSRFQAISRKGVRVRVLPSGAVGGLAGVLSPPRMGTHEDIAAGFLRDNQDILGIDPAQLELGLKKQAGGLTHLLYQQTLNGLPMEFSRVKVHLSGKGEVIGLDSGYLPNPNLSAVPSIGQAQAAAAVGAEIGKVPANGILVYLPVYKTGEIRLAWKFRVAHANAVWNYYVDAKTGQVLFRYNDLRFACAGTGGTITGTVYDMSPSSPTVVRPMSYEKVYVYNDAQLTAADANGNFCSPGSGKIVSGLQGAYVNVAHSNKASAHFDNGGGAWVTVSSPNSSPSPYPGGSAYPNSVVYSALVPSPVPAAVPAPYTGDTIVKTMPHFTSFQVGSFDPNSGISEDDQLKVLDAGGFPVGTYIGNKAAFTGPAVMGNTPSYRLSLSAAPGDSQPGFAVDISSALVLTNAPAVPLADSSFIWTSTMTSDGSVDEVNVYYHINKMHDYFIADVDKSSAAYISNPLAAMVRLGPNYGNAFFDPDHNSLFFGDAGSGAFALDATVIHHEYVHFVIDKIYPIYNFGQNGAMSEAMADYFSGSSLNTPAIGAYVAGSFTSEGSLRNLDCSLPSSHCNVLPTDWQGEIHNDSPILSQALWEVRKSAAGGAACADELVFQSLFFFPGSFQEFLDAMLQVDARIATLAPSCPASNAALITGRFSAHGISSVVPGGDAFEPNDGVQSATNVSTRPVVSANIFPAGDEDFYAFGAAPGPVKITLSLPANPMVPSTYFSYGLTLLDQQQRILAQVFPPVDNGTGNGNCMNAATPDQVCRTLSSTVQLNYTNVSSGQLFVIVTAAPTDDGSPSTTNSIALYTLKFDYPVSGVLPATIVGASFDHDAIHFSVSVSTYATLQNMSFAYAQLRDHAQNPIPQTQTNGPAPYLTVVSTSGASGKITGDLRLTPGFSSRFPAVGTVFLEIYGYDRLQQANLLGGPYSAVEQSLGVSNPLQLTANVTDFKAYNNILRPNLGQKATFKFSITSGGHVTLKLYTMNGVLVTTLVDTDYPAGEVSVDWHGANSNGRTVASGIYLAQLEGPGISKTQKVIVVK